ncbi:hypothetical protein HW132_35180 [Brasilonema sp. CT11]|nr:hypothetical protein [Brasilonema sp. CT11]
MKNPNSVLTVFPLGRSLELEKDKDKEENQENAISEVLNRLVLLERHNQQIHQRLDQLTNLLMEDNEQQIEKKLNESTLDPL